MNGGICIQQNFLTSIKLGFMVQAHQQMNYLKEAKKMSYNFIKANKENDFYPVNQSEIEEVEKI